MAEWKKVVVSGSNISELNNDSGFISSLGSGVVSGSSQISFTGITNVPSGLVSGSSQVDYTGITNVPAGIVSGSAQISLGGDLSGTANSATVTKVQNVSLTSGEATQLANIGSTTISSTQWGYVGALNQGLTTTSAVTFTTVNTGQGANELYAMDQAVQTTDAVTFASVNTGQGANELYAMDQNVRTTDGVTFGGVTSNADVQFNNGASVQSFFFNSDTSVTTIATASVSQNLTVGGDLIVNGDLSYINTTNTAVEDQFILLGSGSTSADVGIIFQTGVSEGTAQGTAFFLDSGVSRLSYATDVAHNSTAVTPAAYIPLVFDVTGQSHTPVDAVGNIKIEDNEAYIYV